jgi:hypothetical protein
MGMQILKNSNELRGSQMDKVSSEAFLSRVLYKSVIHKRADVPLEKV